MVSPHPNDIPITQACLAAEREKRAERRPGYPRQAAFRARTILGSAPVLPLGCTSGWVRIDFAKRTHRALRGATRRHNFENEPNWSGETSHAARDKTNTAQQKPKVSLAGGKRT